VRSLSSPALLALEDGSVFHGTSVGKDGKTIGEVVFNTAMTGYQEILTDPSYCRQIVTLTYPHIGNTGSNSQDMESSKVHASGLVIRDSSMLTSSWRSERSFTDFLKAGKTVAIADIPLLYETDQAQRFDLVIVAACPVEVQLARLVARDGLDETAARRRIAAQLPIDEKRTRADFVIDTSGGYDETNQIVDGVWAQIGPRA